MKATSDFMKENINFYQDMKMNYPTRSTPRTREMFLSRSVQNEIYCLARREKPQMIVPPLSRVGVDHKHTHCPTALLPKRRARSFVFGTFLSESAWSLRFLREVVKKHSSFESQFESSTHSLSDETQSAS